MYILMTKENQVPIVVLSGSTDYLKYCSIGYKEYAQGNYQEMNQKQTELFLRLF